MYIFTKWPRDVHDLIIEQLKLMSCVETLVYRMAQEIV